VTKESLNALLTTIAESRRPCEQVDCGNKRVHATFTSGAIYDLVNIFSGYGRIGGRGGLLLVGCGGWRVCCSVQSSTTCWTSPFKTISTTHDQTPRLPPIPASRPYHLLSTKPRCIVRGSNGDRAIYTHPLQLCTPPCKWRTLGRRL
jgi:hypothetical protein